MQVITTKNARKLFSIRNGFGNNKMSEWEHFDKQVFSELNISSPIHFYSLVYPIQII